MSDARILVADDDPELLDVIVASLTRMGAALTPAKNGAELIEKLADEGPFDLVITDVTMPWMTGTQAMRAARTAGMGLPVIIITAAQDETISARVKALGGNAALLRKPFGLAELEGLVSELLAHRGHGPVSKTEA